MNSTEDCIPRPGYAYASTMRHPANPDTIILSESDCEECDFVGFATIDDSLMVAFRVFAIDGRMRYVFQTKAHCRNITIPPKIGQ